MTFIIDLLSGVVFSSPRPASPLGFYRERAKKNNALSRFLWTSTGVTFAIFVAA